MASEEKMGFLVAISLVRTAWRSLAWISFLDMTKYLDENNKNYKFRRKKYNLQGFRLISNFCQRSYFYTFIDHQFIQPDYFFYLITNNRQLSIRPQQLKLNILKDYSLKPKMLYPNHNNKYLYNVAHSSQEEESSCSECKRNTYGIREEDEEDESSMQVPKRKHDTESSSEDEAEVLYRKHINQQNFKFEEMLKILQYEVDSLKRQNETKDLMIKELKFQVHKSAIEEQRKIESNKQAYEINRLRQQLGCSPRNNFAPSTTSFKSASFQYNPMSQGQPQSPTLQGAIYNPSQSLHLKQKPNSKTMYADSIKPRTSQTQVQGYSADYELKITILEKQIREYQLQLLQQKQRLSHLEQETKWQQKFINSFVKMCDQLSLNYGQKLKLNKLGDDMKKKTKLCWNYMKNLIGFFIQNGNHTHQNDQSG